MPSYTPSRSFTFTLRFDPSAFDAQDMQYALDHLILAFEKLLINSSELPSVVKINSLAEPENPARYTYVYDLLACRATTHPDNVALECDGRVVYTHVGLDAASNQFARYLKDALSVRPGDIVLVFLTQSSTAIVVLCAIQKVSAAYLAVNIGVPTILFQTSGKHSGVPRPYKWIDWSPEEMHDVAFEFGALYRRSCTCSWSYDGNTSAPGRMVFVSTIAHELFWDGSIEEIFLTHYIGGSVCIAMIPEIVSHIHDALVATKANSVALSPTQGEIEAALQEAESKWSITAELVTYNEELRIASLLTPCFVNCSHSFKLQLTADVKAEVLRLMAFIQLRLLEFRYPTGTRLDTSNGSSFPRVNGRWETGNEQLAPDVTRVLGSHWVGKPSEY
ncbi:hypothetical protein M404DRAFT_26946 [Pisolithus tinctorius Marx 270]|uniref:AMP-dependent synthetase/ligase domain-containing protein n=1 Tax=Pisolithus tinctorius Marx 270 TaxID=870435 RepID=A0A0C3J3I5_PISTI|nr:hypothetical protein M404DRAFT_26946 [Pisolithus tinctorius Marx 270]